VITHDDLNYWLWYESHTGHFYWKNCPPHSKIQVGSRAGSRNSRGYRTIMIGKKVYREARLAFLYMTGRWPNPEVDHINRIPGDNRWDNLREACHGLNATNRNMKRPKNPDLPQGVVRYNKRYQARCRNNGGWKHLGMFDTAEEASNVYQNYVKEKFGL
jgi:hypothetical protein